MYFLCSQEACALSSSKGELDLVLSEEYYYIYIKHAFSSQARKNQKEVRNYGVVTPRATLKVSPRPAFVELEEEPLSRTVESSIFSKIKSWTPFTFNLGHA